MTDNNKFKWNDELVEKLKDLYLNQRLTTSQIAKEFNVTKNSIIGKIHRLKINLLVDKSKKATSVKESPSQAKTNFDKYTLEEIDNSMCVWAIDKKSKKRDDTKSESFTFCGREVVLGKSYCQKHLDIVYLSTKRSLKKKKDNIFSAEDAKKFKERN